MRRVRIALAGAAVAGLLLAAGARAAIETKLEPTFKDLGHIHGYLIAPSGEGLTGVLSLRTAEGKKISLHVSDSTRKGRFDIDNLLPGRYQVQVESQGFNVVGMDDPAPVTVEVVPGKVARPRLVTR